jgi:hypothetical protein
MSQARTNWVGYVLLMGTGTVDLTGAKVFLTKEDMRKKFTAKVEQLAGVAEVNSGGRRIRYFFVLSILLQNLATMYHYWACRDVLTPEALSAYSGALGRFVECWEGFAWKPTPWVHWVCAHSKAFMHTHLNWSVFSSIPTEHRHQKFKRDLRNTCQSHKFLNPDRCRGFLQRVIELDALDMGLMVLDQKPQPARETIFEPAEGFLGKRKKV